MILQIVLWLAAAWLAFGAIANIGQIGKEREPVTPAVAITVVITTAIIVTALVLAAFQLSAR